MHILMISDVYFPRINGVSTSIMAYREQLHRLGHKVTLIAPAYPEDHMDDADIIRIPSRYLAIDKEDRILITKYIWRAIKAFPENTFDIIHIQTPFLAHSVGVKLAKRLSIPCVETYHTFFEEYLYNYLPFVPKFIIKFFTRRLAKFQCNQVDSLIVPSTAMQTVLSNYGVKKQITVIPTGLNLSKFQMGNGDVFKHQHNIDFERPTLVHIGRIAYEKNIDFLLHVLVRVKQTIPTVLLIIAGDGPARRHLEKLAKNLDLEDNVLFIGYLDRNKELLDCYCAGDAFVFASRTETQGLVLLEAMALSVPVVSTAVMGTKDILKHLKGALIAREDIMDFSDKVLAILQSPGLRKQLSWDAKMYASRWSQDIFTKQLAHYYSEVIEEYQLQNFKLIPLKEKH